MLIEVPLDSKEALDAKIVAMESAPVWGLVTFEDGVVKSIDYFERREDISDFVDYAIVAKQGEPIWPLMEESIFVLVAEEGMPLGEAMERFKFKELHEASY